MLFDETERVAEAWLYYDQLLEKKLQKITELSGVERDRMIKLNPAEFIEKNRWQRIKGYEYQIIKKWIDANKTDETFLISPEDAEEETAEQIGYKSRTGTSRKIRASKCDLIPVPKEVALDFCVRNHRQSLPHISTAAVYLGLEYRNELVALMGYDSTSGAVRGKKDGYELVRLAIAKGTQVHGGASKLQEACENVLREAGVKRIFSYSNATINSGSVYKKLGFRGGKLDNGQPYVIMNDYRLIRLANLTPYTTNEQLASRHWLKTHIGGNRMWIKDI